jgi:hypothetical protein
VENDFFNSIGQNLRLPQCSIDDRFTSVSRDCNAMMHGAVPLRQKYSASSITPTDMINTEKCIGARLSPQNSGGPGIA